LRHHRASPSTAFSRALGALMTLYLEKERENTVKPDGHSRRERDTTGVEMSCFVDNNGISLCCRQQRALGGRSCAACAAATTAFFEAGCQPPSGPPDGAAAGGDAAAATRQRRRRWRRRRRVHGRWRRSSSSWRRRGRSATGWKRSATSWALYVWRPFRMSDEDVSQCSTPALRGGPT
jgi:hypothetical protein